MFYLFTYLLAGLLACIYIQYLVEDILPTQHANKIQKCGIESL